VYDLLELAVIVAFVVSNSCCSFLGFVESEEVVSRLSVARKKAR
jgi:hypothetical protein